MSKNEDALSIASTDYAFVTSWVISLVTIPLFGFCDD